MSAALPKRIFPPLFNRYEGAYNAFGNHIDNMRCASAPAPAFGSAPICP
ncbi:MULTISPECIES: hypothetical protein [Methylomicrobium]|nr:MULTISPECIES: hypothetical protein [Methylomicrobium]